MAQRIQPTAHPARRVAVSRRTSAIAAPPDTSRRARLVQARLALAAAGLLHLILAVPWKPAAEADVGAFDFSWMLVLHDALAGGRQFGGQIILPYGPLGFIATSVHDPRTFALLLAVRLLISLLVIWALWDFASKAIATPWLRAVTMGAVTLLMTSSADPSPTSGAMSADYYFPVCAILLLVNYFTTHERRPSGSDWGMIVVMAAASLIKVNFALQAMAVIGAISVEQIVARARRGWIIPLIYLGSIALFYLAARQSPLSAPAFVWGWLRVALGHVEAMALPGAFVDAGMFLLLAAVGVATVAWLAWPARSSRAAARSARVAAVAQVAAVAVILALLYKHSFIRQDFAHAPNGPMVLLAISILYLPGALSRPARALRGLGVAWTIAAAVFASSALSAYRGMDLASWAWQQTARRTPAALQSAVQDLTGTSTLRADDQADQAAVRDAFPLNVRAIEGPVDVYSSRADVVFAYHLPYQPRPAVQSLIAATPSLARLDAASLDAPTAPRTLLLNLDSNDANFPTLLDAPSWPRLLARYAVADAGGAMLILRKSERPRPWRLVPLATVRARFEQPIAVPDAAAGPVWVRIKLSPRLGGKVVSALFKPPTVLLSAHTHDGTDHDFRIIPSAAREGFLLSPLLRQLPDFVRLSESAPPIENRIDAITLSLPYGGTDAYFEGTIEVAFDRLLIDR